MEKFILAGIVFLILWEYQRRLRKIDASLLSIELRLKDKVDKPTDFEKLMKERNQKPKLTKEELDEIMTPEEKAYWTKTNGTGYPKGTE